MKQQTVLVVEDEEDILELVSYNLERAGFRVLKARHGEEAMALVSHEKPDLVVLDIMLPKMDGKEVCRRIRHNEQSQSIPIIMLTALAEEVDRIVGFELGADDYLTKPFSPKELVLRVKAILRRKEGGRDSKAVIRFPGILIDPEAFRVEVEGKEVSLTATEFKLLYQLASNAGRIQSREVLLERVWGYTYDGYARTVDTHVRRLRQKLGPASGRVETVRGVGYRFRG
ncbi:MAG: response regulator transcription factor [Thermodesulfobacteriota bacterium]